ncbi:MAG: hypothetical protein VB084_01695 [Syntrophomonadaceae bacterium]|nr:hypothetical protein [Syntrophomonadaceae bacterium]
MQQFSNVRRELKKWLGGFEWANLLMPVDIYVLFGSLGLMFINEILGLVHIYAPLNILSTLGYWGFLLGCLVTLVSPNIKYLPYGLWGYAFTLLFPFTYFSFSTIIGVLIWAYLGYAVMQYSAIADINV